MKYMYFPLMALAAIISFAKALSFAKLIDVEEFGFYTVVMSSYIFIVFFGGLGVQEGYLKKASILYENKEDELATKYLINAIFFPVSLLTLILLLAIITNKIISSHLMDYVYLAVVLACNIIVFNMIDTHLRAYRRRLQFATIICLKSFIVFVFGAGLMADYGAKGLLLSEIFGPLIIILIIVPKYLNINSIRKISFTYYRDLVYAGYQMLAVLIVRNISLIIDKWVITLTLGIAATGIYSFSMLLFSICLLSLGPIAAIYGPIWIGAYSKNKNPKLLINNVTKIIFLLLAGLIGCFPILVMTKEFLLIFYPQYNNEIIKETILVVYLSLIFVVPVYFYDWVFVCTTNEKLILQINAIFSIFSFASYIFAYFQTLTISEFSYLFLMNRILLFFMYLIGIRKIYAYRGFTD